MLAALTGATEFYANPPNFADPALLIATKNTYHDSLDVDAGELQRQYRREIDLAKILARLYEDYVELVAASGRMTGRDAVVAATRVAARRRRARARLRERHRFAFVDDAQELTEAEPELLRAIFGERLAGVTLCGDPSSAVSTRAPHATRSDLRALARAREAAGAPPLPARRACSAPPAADEEAAFVADRVAEWIGRASARSASR